MAQVKYLYRYPIKGLSGEMLERCVFNQHHMIEGDRAYAIAHASSGVDLAKPEWHKKRHFLNLMNDEKLGELTAEFGADGVMVLSRQGRKVVQGDLRSPHGRMVLDNFLAAFMPTGARGHPRLIAAGNAGHFCDQAHNYLSLINLASIEDIARVVRAPLDHRRMRGNVYIDGLPAWAEQQWIGGTLRLGQMTFDVVEPIERCHAINMNPQTGKVDKNLPLAMRRGFRHADCGVFLRVKAPLTPNGSGLAVGDLVGDSVE